MGYNKFYDNLFHIVSSHAIVSKFEMDHLDTLEFSSQIVPSELPTKPRIYPLKPTTSKTLTGQEGDPGVTSHIPGSHITCFRECKECERMNPHPPK
jgi:hypothetical protein